MATSPSVWKVPCVCTALMRVNEAGSGAITTSCPECKAQGWFKSPKASAALRAKYGSGAPVPDRAPIAEPVKEEPGLLDGL